MQTKKETPNFHNQLKEIGKSHQDTKSNDASLTTHDYLPQIHSNLFLSVEESLHNEPQLYSVEQGELQPISSPFMVPGIYRKIDMTSAVKPLTKQTSKSNVFLTESEHHGRIVARSDFHKLYVCENGILDEFNNNSGQPCKVFPIKNGTLPENQTETEKILPQAAKDEMPAPNKWDALTKLAYNILKLSTQDHCVVINRLRNEIVRTEKSTSKKTIYRFLDNESMGIKPPEMEEGSEQKLPVKSKKLGRPKKRLLEKTKDSNDDDKISSQSKLAKTSDGLNEEQSKKDDNASEKPAIPSQSTKMFSRYGRVIKSLTLTPLIKERENNIQTNSSEYVRTLISDLNDKDFTCNLELRKTENQKSEISSTDNEVSSVPPTKRYVPPESICPTCNKIFLGRRLKRHFVDHPDHMKTQPPPVATETTDTNSNSTEEMTLFRFLVSKLQKSNLNEDQRADLFLHELNDLVEQLQSRSSRLIRNTSGLHLVSARTARVLSIPEGQYALDMAAIEAPPEPEPPCQMNFDGNALPVPLNNARSLDYTAISLDDTLTDEAAQKLNLSAGGKLLPPSEESLLRAVDDFVPPAVGIDKLVVPTNHLHPPVSNNSSTSSATLVPHYDHASDNAVEAVSMKENSNVRQAPPLLDLTVDFFQFNTK